MKYRFTEHAEGCLDEIVDRIAQDKPDAALTFYQKVVETCESATTFPYTGREVEYFGDPEMRCKNINGHEQYLMFYRIARKEIVVSLVVNSTRLERNYLDEI